MTEPTTQPAIQVAIPTPTGTLNLEFRLGTSIVIIGANGSGKTRLGVHIEEAPATRDIVHRIAAQKMLAMEEVQLVALETAENSLLYGNAQAQPGQRTHYRWQNKPATQLLNDFQALLQTLFGQQNRVAVRFLDQHRRNPGLPTPRTVCKECKKCGNASYPIVNLSFSKPPFRSKLCDPQAQLGVLPHPRSPNTTAPQR